jgi:transcriptional regulator with XRE-family HTH domain
VIDLLQESLRESGKNQSDLAEELGLSRSAVSQVLLGDGNLRVATLAEYLFALGRKVHLDSYPLNEEIAVPNTELFWRYTVTPSLPSAGTAETTNPIHQGSNDLIYDFVSDSNFTLSSFNVVRHGKNSETAGAA